MFKNVSYISPSVLQDIWKKNGGTVIVNFAHPSSTLSKRSMEHVGNLSQKFVGTKLLFLNSEMSLDESETFIDDYKFIRFPAIIVLTKAGLIRFNSWKEISDNLEVKVRELQLAEH
jgi:hypothetical protein